jgi:hypothetical protein
MKHTRKTGATAERFESKTVSKRGRSDNIGWKSTFYDSAALENYPVCL